MKRQIRRGVFETNSSSTHSLTMCSEEEFEAWKRGEVLFQPYGKKDFVSATELSESDKKKAEEDYEENKTEFQKDWNDLLKYLSSVSNLYNYPTGEPWPFLLPSTIEENLNEISNFTILREPRFEIVYDNYTNVVTIQIDVETDLSKFEVETLFPKNQGIYFSSLEDTFKTVYLDYTDFINIRLDIRFQRLHSDFESGEWFVSQGKRI